MVQWCCRFHSRNVRGCPPSDTSRNTDFTLDRGSISGSVFTPAGLPLNSGASVYVCDVRGRQIGSGNRVIGGTYTVSWLPTGQYKLFCSYAGEDNYASEWYNGKPSSQNAAVINIVAPANVPSTNFTLEYRAAVAGFVSDKGGARLTVPTA